MCPEAQLRPEEGEKLNLDDAQSLDQALGGIASAVPANMKEAVSAYVAMRKNRLKAEALREPSYKGSENRYRTAALADLLAALDIVKEPEVVPDERPPRGVPRDEHYAWLADILTPVGWDQKGGILEVVSEWEKDATEKLLESDDEEARAKQREAVWLSCFLRNTARKGNRARAMLRSNAERVMAEVVHG